MDDEPSAALIGTVVDEVPSALYRFYDLSSRLLYVGVSDSLAVRWGRHAATSPWWPEVAIKTVQWYPTRRGALDAETAAIADEDPVHNKRRPRAEEMTMRSWYMTGASAELLEALVDDLHQAGGLPKRSVMAALVDVAEGHQAEIEAEARALAR